ncbi:murein biosynthesis integral membrane protein MurJ [Rossellomorea marisflavi]|uniref:murein biosynthesis integral membrane protein MurJ n=1 Tax=Rossellomorea marisflavi TaxID=189381 RepID=UPI0011E73948|nr:murein biosynthesis integral membrane protein MurJ [Rossellomorea marisflavi]TYO74330.1 murein biosynthesis integral membrane protein MurJ [Rossellomorea marisflavi]
MKSLIKAVGLVTIISGLGKLLGFARESIIAAYFGTSDVADVFFVSSLVPTLLFTAIGTAIQAGTIPLFMEARGRSKKESRELMSLLGTFFLVISLSFIAVTLLFTEPLMKLMAPGFTPGQLDLAVDLTRIMIPSMIFLTLTAISTGVLNANTQFVLPAFTSTVQNIVIILATVLLTNMYGVFGLAAGVLMGAAGQFFIQYPSFRKEGIGFNFAFKENKEQIKRIMILFYPIIIAAISIQLNSLVDRMVSSGLETGSVSALNYGNRLLWLPLSVILTPLITVLYPSLVEGALESYKRFFTIIHKGTAIILFAGLPFTVLLAVSGDDLIRLAFERGSFDAGATSITFQALFYYGIGLVFFALRDFLMNGFYALKKTKIAMYSCLGAVAANVVLSIILARFMGVGGIALASSISMLIQCIVLFSYLLKGYEEKKTYSKRLGKESGKLLLTTAGAAAGALATKALLANDLNIIIHTAIMTAVIFIIYCMLAFLFKVQAVSPLTQKLKRSR